MTEEAAENKLLYLLKQGNVNKPESFVESQEEIANNKLLQLLREKSKAAPIKVDAEKTVEEATVEKEKIEEEKAKELIEEKKEPTIKESPKPAITTPPVKPREPVKVPQSKTAPQVKSLTREEISRPELLQLFVTLDKDEIAFLEKVANEVSRFGIVRHFIFSQSLMGQEIPAIPELKEANELLKQYSRSQKAILNKLLVSFRLGKDIKLNEFRDFHHDELLSKLYRDFHKALQKCSEQKIAYLEGQDNHKILLVASLCKEDLKLLDKIVNEKETLGLLRHLFFTHILMGKEVVVRSSGEISIILELNSILREYWTDLKDILNRLLVKTRTNKAINLKDQTQRLDNLLKNFITSAKTYLNQGGT